MLNVLGYQVSLDELEKMEVSRPKGAGRYWGGVKHYDLATTLRDIVRVFGAVITDERWAVSRDRQDMVGGLVVDFNSTDGGSTPIPGVRHAIGIRNSNNRRWAITMAVGAEVLVCNNGVITGTRVLSRRHTKRVVLKDVIYNGVTHWVRNMADVNQGIERLQRRQLTIREKDHLLMEAMRQGIIAGGHLLLIDKEYMQPRHSEFEKRNAWSLYNAFTTVAQDSLGSGRARFSPIRQFESFHQFYELLAKAA